VAVRVVLVEVLTYSLLLVVLVVVVVLQALLLEQQVTLEGTPP
jgi:hypothetical protein